MLTARQQNVSEYPLIARRGGGTFKSALHGFFISLIQTIAQSGLLYESTELIENIQVWVSTMSSAPNRCRSTAQSMLPAKFSFFQSSRLVSLVTEVMYDTTSPLYTM